MKCAHTITVAVLLLVIVIGTGCDSVCNPADIQAFAKPHEVNVTMENYVLQPPDEIAIHCTKVPEIHLQVQRIRPDGKVSYEGLGEMEVAGKTVGEVVEMMRQKVAELYKLIGDYPIEVRVVGFRSKVFYVLGQVDIPGVKIYTGRDSLLTAVSEARVSVTAWEQRTRVIRPSHDPSIRPKVFRVNYKRMITRGDATKDVLLQEGDIIYIPPTILAAIAMKLEEAIRPLARAFSGAYMSQNFPTENRTGTSGNYGGYRGY